MKVAVNPDIRGALRPLTDAERADLRIKLQSEGCVEDFCYTILDGVATQLDGHNRREICQAEKIKMKGWRLVKLPSLEAAIEWVHQNQISRRNLTANEVSYSRGKQYLQKKKAVGRPSEDNDDTLSAFPENRGRNATAETIAEGAGVSGRTVQRDAEFAEAVDKIEEKKGTAAKHEALNGEMTKSEIIKKATGKKRKPKQGDLLFDWRKFNNEWGAMYRAVDTLCVAVGYVNKNETVRECREANEMRTCLREFKNMAHAFFTKASKEKVLE